MPELDITLDGVTDVLFEAPNTSSVLPLVDDTDTALDGTAPVLLADKPLETPKTSRELPLADVTDDAFAVDVESKPLVESKIFPQFLEVVKFDCVPNTLSGGLFVAFGMGCAVNGDCSEFEVLPNDALFAKDPAALSDVVLD